jgi:hypothetical protein
MSGDRCDDGLQRWVAIVVFLGHAHLADPYGKLAPVAGHKGDLGDREAVLEMVRQPGGTWLVVSNHAVADLYGLHG